MITHSFNCTMDLCGFKQDISDYIIVLQELNGTCTHTLYPLYNISKPSDDYICIMYKYQHMSKVTLLHNTQ